MERAPRAPAINVAGFSADAEGSGVRSIPNKRVPESSPIAQAVRSGLEVSGFKP
jgi:hypothetical protein